jgi:2'-5' RNA ligase
MEHPLWFIAVLPPPEIQEEVTAFKLQAKERFKSKHALKSPPHLTLIPPFRMQEAKLDRLHSFLTEFAASRHSFELELSGFDCFAPRVIFVDIAPSEALNDLQAHLKRELLASFELELRMRSGFHPHMTIAFKDLSRSKFEEAWSFFNRQTYERPFIVNAVFLLKYEDRRWKIHQQFSFSSATN